MTKLLEINKNHKKLDDSYFDNYGGDTYSKVYIDFTIHPKTVIDQLVANNIYFESLLDVGCASGEIVKDFRGLGIRAYGIENNSKILKNCVVPQFCEKMDMKDMKSIKDNTFDVIYTNSLMYLFPQEIKKTLDEFYRISKIAVYLCVPFLDETTKFSDPYRVFLGSRTWWRDQFENSKFKKISDSIYRKTP